MFTIASGARDTHVMAIEDTRRSQRPYRYGIILLCCGALVNWLGLTENYGLPVRYLGISCIICGALLICSAMCCWFHNPHSAGVESENENSIHVISVPGSTPTSEKPPAYEAVIIEPPTYDDAIKLNPALLGQVKDDKVQSPAIMPPSSPVQLPRQQQLLQQHPAPLMVVQQQPIQGCSLDLCTKAEASHSVQGVR